MTAARPRTPRSRRLIGIGAATLLAVPASLILATPAHAAAPDSATFTSSTASEWTVPAGVREVLVTAIGGSGGNASGEHSGVGGFGASVESVLAVEPGQVLTVWAGAAGGVAGDGRTHAGLGGAGYTTGGSGATSGGSQARPGAGGGGSSAVSLDGSVVVVAGGGGGGGGRGADDGSFLGIDYDACRGGNGGAAGEAGAPGYTTTPNVRPCTVQDGGAAGIDSTIAGSNAQNVQPTPVVNVNAAVGGSGGGGAGAGEAGERNIGTLRNGGGGGGGGGASLGDTVGVAAAAGNGSVLLEWEVAYTTALEVNVSPEPSVIGETVSYTVLVENTETMDASPVGDVTLDFGNGEVVTAPLEATGTANLASATFERDANALGLQSVSASYTPTEGSPFAPAEGGADFTVEKGDSLTVLDVQPVDPEYFNTVRATATVSVVDPAVAELSGYVAFFNGDEAVGIVPVDPATGEAFVDFTVTEVGAVNVTAYYGDDVLLNNSDAVVEYNAHAASTTTTLKASSKEIAHGGKVKFEAAVVANLPAPVESELPQTGGDLPGGEDVVVNATDVEIAAADVPVAPAGVVRFMAGDKLLGEVALSANGTAAFETAELASGTHEVVAHFVSSVPELASSKSDAVKVTVAAAKAGLASTGVDAGLLGGSALLAALLMGLGAAFMIRRRQTA
jgi:hypothetical protein